LSAEGGADGSGEAEFCGEAQGWGVGWVDEADGAGVFREVRCAPGEDGVHGFSGVALAVSGGGEDPSGLGGADDGGDDVAVEVGETGFTEQGAGGFFFDDPVAEAEHLPVACGAQETEPGFFFGGGFADGVAGDGFFGPEGGVVRQVASAVGAEAEAFGFEGWGGGYVWQTLLLSMVGSMVGFVCGEQCRSFDYVRQINATNFGQDDTSGEKGYPYL
jgi:hypothetical protein